MATIKYKVVEGKNPVSGETVLRAQVVDAPAMDQAGLIDFCLKGGYIRGQKEDMTGVSRGLFEGVYNALLQGYRVTIDGLASFALGIGGAIDAETRVVDRSKNELFLNVTPRKDMKPDMADYTFEAVGDEALRVKISTVASAGQAAGYIKALGEINVNGENLEFHADWGDTATLAWYEGKEEKSVALTCSSSDNTRATFKFPDEIVGLDKGTKLTLTLKTHAGVEDGTVSSATKVATFLGYTDDTPYMWQVHTDGQAVNTVKMDDTNPCIVSGANIAACVGATLMVTAKDGAAGPFMIGEDEILTKSFNKVTFLVPTSKLPESLKDHDLAGADVNVTLSCTNGTLTDFHCAYAE